MYWIILILTLLSPPRTDKLEYDIYYRGKDIGDYVVERTLTGNVAEYKSHSITNVHIMGKIAVSVTQNVRYEGGVLTRSEAITSVNGHQHDHVKLRKLGHSYEITSGDEVYNIGDEIRYSMVMLMFEEPRDLGRVFSEVEGEFHRIERKSSQHYIKTNSKGRKNYYTFDQRCMKQAEVDSGFYRFEMKRRS